MFEDGRLDWQLLLNPLKVNSSNPFPEISDQACCLISILGVFNNWIN
jgi:hypothetical protein